ncbi:MAG: hypothetical protein KZQ66_11055 [Candidatus Thiodiazotropha sp. (ex Lucinoma aequizonata)]|nr:hypothetical protein [Candidatus Thiodiazotropha sp. (ex Lucinoma aequizonata)]MCU7900010.1 hypothetical protein [Candidatus Thiodiazotropha sp. (ex Lucinoma aequizonata)]MCU7902462.1 hypothetical protein [Candidatus Thiodiazotropha sp. (ex Lucinoma aequizonata)]MCU7907266.1 hypothetical protein [Candidatus Thiodiazotropha sp. (ex Lucinoma aequizonata)]MCU7910767.1 hypothetical protein [Candidatus Thiodiazotropha sp. (ex Lucinoma aequizonata)]
MRHLFSSSNEYANGVGRGCGAIDGAGSSVGITYNIDYDVSMGRGMGDYMEGVEDEKGATDNKGSGVNSGNGSDQGKSYGTGILSELPLKIKKSLEIKQLDCNYKLITTSTIAVVTLLATIGLLHLNGFFQRLLN